MVHGAWYASCQYSDYQVPGTCVTYMVVQVFHFEYDITPATIVCKPGTTTHSFRSGILQEVCKVVVRSTTVSTTLSRNPGQLHIHLRYKQTAAEGKRPV